MIDLMQDKEKSIIMFFDEGRFGLRSTTMRMWAEKGKPAIVKVRQGFKNFYAYSAVCPFTGDNFSLLLPGVNTDLMNIYLEGLSKHFYDKQIYLIMDGAGWHKSKGLKNYKNIMKIIQPAYSPELNPIEKLWEWMKKECMHNFFYNTLEEIMDIVCEEFRKLKEEDLKRLCNCNYLSYVI